MSVGRKLAAGDFVVLVELEPPKGVDVSSMLRNATKVRTRVDGFMVPEMNTAVMRMSALGAAALLQARGLETIMQVCCRDRNRLALQGDLLAAAALGVQSVMAVTGDDPSYGDHHRARAVYDIDLIELLRAIQTLQQGRDMAGVELQGSPRFLVGSSVNAGASGGALDLELEELDRKVEAGAEFFVTPPIFDPQVYSSFMKKVGARPVKIIPTVLLLKSVGMARYIDRHIDNVHVPGEMITRVQKAPEKVRECVTIAAELIAAFRERHASGVLISTLGWEDKLELILDAAKI